jgi:hypothetical protein
MTTYRTYRSFDSRVEAAAMQALLSKNGIPSSLEENKTVFDTAIVGVPNTQSFIVRIPQDHFLTANAVLEEAVNLDELEVEDDYYLLSFSEEELLDLVKKKDEWGEFDYALARKLLAERGIPLTDVDIKRMEKERVQTLRKADAVPVVYIIAGYLVALFSTLIAVAVGLYLVTSYRRLPDGHTAHKYNDSARFHGKCIMALSVLVVLGAYAYAMALHHPFDVTRFIFRFTGIEKLFA